MTSQRPCVRSPSSTEGLRDVDGFASNVCNIPVVSVGGLGSHSRHIPEVAGFHYLVLQIYAALAIVYFQPIPVDSPDLCN